MKDEDLYLPFEEVALIYTDVNECFVITFENEKLIWPHTIEFTIKKLPKDVFFHISRSMIININNISLVTDSTSRRFTLTLKYPASLTISVSQRQRQAFTEWFKINKK